MAKSELSEKVQASIARLKAFEPKSGEGYYLAFSGGKDSVVCKALLDMAVVKYDSTYRVTSVDPPELVRFIMEKHPDVKREIPRYPDRIKSENLRGKPITMWNLIPKEKYPPTRISRYCCRNLKESGGDGRVTVTGVRWAESRNRKENQGLVNIHDGGKIVDSFDAVRNKSGGIILTNDNDDARRMVEQCYRRHKTTVNPIVDWSDAEVWEFIKAENIPYCGLYDDGFHRLGCIGCPMSRGGAGSTIQSLAKIQGILYSGFHQNAPGKGKRWASRLRHWENGPRCIQLVDGIRYPAWANIYARKRGGRICRKLNPSSGTPGSAGKGWSSRRRSGWT